MSSKRTLRPTTLATLVAGLVMLSLFASWVLITLQGAWGWTVTALLAIVAATLAVVVARFGPRHVAPLPLAASTMAAAALLLSLGGATIAVLGVDGQSAFSIGWNQAERAAWPQLTVGGCLLAVGIPLSRRVQWVRALQARDEPGSLAERDH